jgi:DNA-binding response OmpR family regulator
MPTILIVDDDQLVRRFLQALLGAGHTLIEAAGGTDALAAATAQVPDLIITDVVMPGMDGWALVRALRSRPATALVPVLFLTGLDSAEHRTHGFQLGADDYVAKNCDAKEIRLRVQRILDRTQAFKRQTREVARQHRSGMMGDLSVIGPASLLMLFEMERKTGELHLKHDDQEVRLLVRDGRIIDAGGREPSETPEEYVYQVLGWASGEFFLASTTVAGEDRIGIPTSHLLMEGARRLDEDRRG